MTYKISEMFLPENGTKKAMVQRRQYYFFSKTSLILFDFYIKHINL